jgi:alkanesulfonate monooxygenase SsuD/methylene tetrahydromethanopterin reductase-like flavin-dependent oxidoreductase (luciferase family)
VLQAHCEAVGRDSASITPSTGGQVIIRDSASELESRFDELVERHRVPRGTPSEFTGTIDHVATHIAERLRAGTRLFIGSAATPFDEESLRRLAKEVWPQAKERARRPT